MVKQRNEKKVIDVVKDNAVWINAIEKEKLTAEAWDKTWGFYKQGLPERERTVFPKINSTLPPGLTNDPDSLISAYLSNYNIKSLKKLNYPTQKYLAPPTTQSEVGWTYKCIEDARLKELQLIPFGQARKQDNHPSTYTIDRFKYCRGKGSVYKWWGGGLDSLKRSK